MFKKISVFFMLAMLVMGTSMANAAWYKCTIRQVGALNSQYNFLADCSCITTASCSGSFTGKWFSVSDKTQFAILLTGIASGNTVNVSSANNAQALPAEPATAASQVVITNQ